MDQLRYPIGRFSVEGEIRPEQRRIWIVQLEETPVKLRLAVRGLSDEQLDTPYRPGGWTVRQVAHHVVDSQINSYVRFKLALTEEQPLIKPYDENRWVELADAKEARLDESLVLLDALHRKWVVLLHSLTDSDFTRTFRHPEHGVVRLDFALGFYAWHCRHHTAHITSLRERMGWQ
jgi:uncharacterized damage-inducible protein DinB